MSQAIPGGGLPKFERFYIKTFLIPMIKYIFTWDLALKLFNKEAKKIEKIVKQIKKEDLQKRVKIKRVFGIEDHSRDYSINMTLEHLVIAGTGVMGIIHTLSQEKKFAKEVTIQGVKPHANEADTLEAFVKFTEKYTAFIDALPKKKSLMRHQHPWFIEFNNFEWSVFMFIHTFVHRRQIEAIAKILRDEGLVESGAKL